MINKNISLSLSDVSIVPEVISNINSRTECIPYVNGMLPLFTAPMSCVVSLDNINIFKKNLITPIVPRNINFDKRIENLIAGNWVAFSLDEFEETFSKSTTFKDIRDNSITRFVSSNGLVLDANNTYYALIDIANGHMNRLKEAIEKAKFNYEKHIVIMAGNIANPKTYVELSNAGADYIRVGIGGGSGCFVKNTLITMSNNSLKPIQDIGVGDNVKTLDGEHVVLSTKTTYCHKKIKINNEIECTLDHKFLVINKDDKCKINDDNLMKFAFYIEAEKLDMGKHLLVKNV
jgi:hypothetical protein